MTTQLYTHPSCLGHDPGPMHPERPERLGAVMAALEMEEFNGLARREAPRVEREQLLRVHPAEHVDFVLTSVPEVGNAALDADTFISPGSGEAALRAAGALCAAADAVIAREAGNAFCAVRPPGHHAEPSRPMGFCLFNNVAVGALHLREAHGLKRIAVMDFDVHHGNGTQAAFWDDADLFFASTHQMPLYPGSGAAHERGVADNILNVPLPPGAGSREFRAAMTESVLPALKAFKPEFLLVSAGFDAHADDPLASLALREEDYGWATAELASLANEVCDGRLVSTLEGGYDLGALGRSAAAHVRALMQA